MVQAVIVGADRITLTGDVTYRIWSFVPGLQTFNKEANEEKGR